VKKNFQFKAVCNGDTAYITHLNSKYRKIAIIFAKHSHKANLLLSNSNYALSRASV